MSAERWRLIDSGPGDAHFNMALDEALARSVRDDARSPEQGGMYPTLRLYAWRTPSVTLGRFQRASEVDTALCAERGIPFVRRITGGRAILHGAELTYSFSAPILSGSFAHKGLFESYAALSTAFMEAFVSLGLKVSATSRRRADLADAGRSARISTPQARGKSPLCFSSTSFAEITIDGRKIIGSAQRRWPGGMLQQGSIPLKQQREDAGRVFGDKVAASGLMGLCEADPLITYESLRDALRLGFEKAFAVTLVQGQPTESELELAASLEAERYRAREWNYLR